MPHLVEIAVNIAAAWAAGTVIGLERTWNGRAAGFRTHALVALAAAATALVSFEPMLHPDMSGDPHLDASRLSQGVMTGIGFLGAGVIFKEGLSVQGLTTAASVWACAAAGFLFGLGMYAPGAMVVAAILATLGLLKLIEDRAPWPVYAYAVLRFRADEAPAERELVSLLGEPRLKAQDLSYRLLDDGRVYEYSANLVSAHEQALSDLAGRLRQIPGLVEFELERA